MGIFSWLFPSKAEETVAERALPPGIEAPQPVSEEELALESKYKYFRVPENVDSKQLLKAYNECLADIRAAKNPKLITTINYCAISCIDAIANYYVSMSSMALDKNKVNLIFYVLKNGLSSIDLSALTVPEIEKISSIIKMITYTQIPEEIKFVQVTYKYETGKIIYNVDIQQLNLDSIERILDFLRMYKEILLLLSTKIKDQYEHRIFGGYIPCVQISDFIKKIEENLKLAEQSAGSDIEIFREEYLCHSTNTIIPISHTRLFFKRDVYFCLNHVHTGSRPTLIFSVADVLKEVKERNLNFAFALAGNYTVQIYFMPKYNMFYDKSQKKYLTFAETKALIKNDRWVAAIYTEEEKTLENCALRSPGVFVISDQDISIYVREENIGNQYPLFEIKLVLEEQQDPQKHMFVGDRSACEYLLHDTEGRRILKSMLESQRR